MILLKYSTSDDYISNWGYPEAVREIVQNFRDFGEYDETIVTDYQTKPPRVFYENIYQPKGYEFLKVGFSKKHTAEAVGKYGEGIKMALLVLLRLGLNPKIFITLPDKTVSLTPVFYDDEQLGKCYGIELNETPNEDGDVIDAKFRVSFDYDEKHEKMKDYFLKPEHILFNSSNGSIVDKPAGNVYVGGIYVNNYPDIPRAYDLLPSRVTMGRDRDFPSDYSVSCNVSYVYNDYLQENPEILDSACHKELYSNISIPDIVAETIEPTMLGGQIKYRNSETKVLYDDKFTKSFKETAVISDKLGKLKNELNKRKSSVDLMEVFWKKYRYSIYDTEMLDDLKVIVKAMGIKDKVDKISSDDLPF